MSRPRIPVAQIMDMTQTRRGAEVIELTEIATICTAIVAWFDACAAGHDPPLDGLDRAVAGAKALPRLPGAFGRALTAVATGGRGCSRHDIVAVIDQLRRAAHTTTPTDGSDLQPVTSPSSAARGRRRPAPNQLCLPLTGTGP
jgi:hypothetical protein